MIATAKMKRSQDRALMGRPYDIKISQVIADLAAEGEKNALHPLLQRRDDVKKIGLVHISTNRGLCGGLNSNLNKLSGSFILEQQVPVSVIAVGRKGSDFMYRSQRQVRADFNNISDKPGLLETLPVSKLVVDDYTSGYVDLVYISYTRFINTFSQKPVLEPLLPITPSELPKAESKDYIYEPNASQVLEGLLPRYVEMKIYHAILEAAASEQSARMVAMRNATDNANDLIQHLTLMLNKARQEMITTELLDITGGVEILH